MPRRRASGSSDAWRSSTFASPASCWCRSSRWRSACPVLTPDPREVAAILRVPVRHFLPGAPIEIVEAERDGWRLRYGAFPVGEHHVWGATARVLGQLGAVLGG